MAKRMAPTPKSTVRRGGLRRSGSVEACGCGGISLSTGSLGVACSYGSVMRLLPTGDAASVPDNDGNPPRPTDPADVPTSHRLHDVTPATGGVTSCKRCDVGTSAGSCLLYTSP